MTQLKPIITEKERAKFVRQIKNTNYLTGAIAIATREAVLEHKRNGNPIAIWKDGAVVIVQPEDIVVDEVIDPVNG